MEKAYPTRHGMPVGTHELELAPSRLDARNPNNYSWHHLYFDSPQYAANALYNTLRNLKNTHEHMLNDQHNLGRQALHSLYSPPPRPSLTQAMERVEMGYLLDEPLHFRVKGVRGWQERLITPEDMQELKIIYDRENDDDRTTIL